MPQHPRLPRNVRLLLRRTLHAFDNHGMRGLLRRLAGRLLPARSAGGADARKPAASMHLGQPSLQLPHPFDLAHGADTGGYVPGEQLAAHSPSAHAASDFYNTAYWAISPSTFLPALALLPGAPDTLAAFTLVDLGCGKGRALLLAATLPFRAVLGVELSPALARIAQANARHSDANEAPRTSAPISVLEQDAATFTFPPGPLVVFLYHPFLAPVLRRVLRNLEQQVRATPRPVFLLYANPTYPRVMRRFRFLQPVWEYSFPLSPEDAAADRHGITEERYALWRAEP